MVSGNTFPGGLVQATDPAEDQAPQATQVSVGARLVLTLMLSLPVFILKPVDTLPFSISLEEISYGQNAPPALQSYSAAVLSDGRWLVMAGRTADLVEKARGADILVAAVGVPRFVKGDWVKPGAAVIDVGVSSVDGELVGDVDLERAIGVASVITPHRRGVGPMTITMLLHNTLIAYRSRISR